MKFGIAGAGFSGAVIARQLAERGHHVDVFDRRDHVGGNCFTERDSETGILLHRYGPHIFHTGNERVWQYINRFAEMKPYQHRVRTTVNGQVFPLPINLLTINQLFRSAFGPTEARDFVEALADDSITSPQNFEQQALQMFGRRIYETFFYGYTKKQWGLEPSRLPASILKRLPLRYDYNDSYFDHPYQAIPAHGYTPIIEAILDHPGISVTLSTSYDSAIAERYDHTIWTGPLDAWFGHRHGRLSYRTLDFVEERVDGDFQGCPVMNYGDADVAFTRITEHKHFAPWEPHDRSVVYREYSRAADIDDIPYYPVRLADDQQLLRTYAAEAVAARGVTFVGRLGTYRYLDMDVAVAEALHAADEVLSAITTGVPIPSTVVPLVHD